MKSKKQKFVKQLYYDKTPLKLKLVSKEELLKYSIPVYQSLSGKY